MTHKIKDFLLLKNFPLMTKLCTYFAFLILTTMAIVGWISYSQSSATINKEVGQYNKQIIEQVKKHVEYYVRDLRRDAIKLLNDSNVQSFLEMNSLDEVEKSQIEKPIEELLRNTASFRSDINNIMIISEGIKSIDLIGDHERNSGASVTSEYWYSLVPKNGDVLLISRQIPWRGRTEPVVTLARRTFHPKTLEPSGMIIFDVNFKRFQEITEEVKVGETGFMYILDSQNRYIYHPNLKVIGELNNNSSSSETLGMESGNLITEKEPRNFLTFSASKTLGWTIVITTPYEEIMKGVRNIRGNIIFACIISLFFCYLLAIVLSKSLLKPIQRLQQNMQTLQNGDFSVRMPVESTDEVGELSKGFNIMSVKLEQLLEDIYISKVKEAEMSLRQKETELKALQAQINPHFLYNSLETIRGIALENDMDDIGDMSVSLAKLLRYNIKSDSLYISMKEELAACALYLKIQKYRYEEKLTFTFDIEDWVLNQTTVKFSLQPLVENCIVHGTEYHTGKTNIKISAKRETNFSYAIEILDTGQGMTEETLKKLKNNMFSEEMPYSDQHIGIINVHKRLTYLFGKEYGLCIKSIPFKGTCVRIRLPIDVTKK